MKRLSSIVAFGVLVILFVAGCSQDVKFAADSNVSPEVQEAIIHYSDVGKRHNLELERFYFSQMTGRSGAVAYKSLAIEDMYGEVERIYFGDMIVGRSADGATVVETLAEKQLVSENAVALLARIEKLLRNPLSTRELMNQAIVEVQEVAVATLDGTELDQVMSYAETAKASLEFWTENFGTLTNENSGWSLQKWWDTNKHKIAMMAVSDAAGAAVGAILGASIGSSVGGVGAGPGAGVGAVICGAASSIQGFKDDKFCVVIPWEQLNAGVIVVQ